MPKRKKYARSTNLKKSKAKAKKIKTETEEMSSGTSSNDSIITIEDGLECENNSPSHNIKDYKFEDRTKEIFYKLSADASFLLSDKKIIKINKAMFYLHAKSDPIFQLLFTSTNENMIEITDIDSVTFKLFVDCVMGFTPHTVENVATILPVILKYQIEKSIQECIQVLEPKNMNENVCNCLNMAVSYKCTALIDKIINFIYDDYNPYRFLENETYLFLLEPDSLLEIIKKLDHLDCFTMKIVMKWGKNYIDAEKTVKFESVKALFEVFNFVTYFENSLKKFGAPEIVPYPVGHYYTNVFPTIRMVSLLKRSKNIDFRCSTWKFITEGESFTEEIITSSLKCEKPVNLLYEIVTNSVIYYKVSHRSNEEKVLLYADMNVDGGEMQQFIWMFHNDAERVNKPNRYFDWYSATHFCLEGDNLRKTFTLKITYTFMYDCRILLMNMSKDCFNNQNLLYFTKNVNLVGLN